LHGIALESNGVVPADKHESSEKDAVREFDKDLRQHEDLPAIHLGRTFTYFVKVSLDDEMRHGLLHELTKDGKDIENGKHLVLETLDRVSGVQEDKADEESLQV